MKFLLDMTGPMAGVAHGTQTDMPFDSSPNMIDEPGPARCSTNPTYEGEYSYDDIYVDTHLPA